MWEGMGSWQGSSRKIREGQWVRREARIEDPALFPSLPHSTIIHVKSTVNYTYVSFIYYLQYYEISFANSF